MQETIEIFILQLQEEKSMEIKKQIPLLEKIRKNEFYEDVFLKEGKSQLKEFMSNWTRKLQSYKQIDEQITIKKFKDLLIPIGEIVFPIEIDYVFSRKNRLDANFTDNEGKSYYIIVNTYGYNEVNTYVVGRRNSKIEPLIDREFTLEITAERINLIETGLLKLKEDGTNSDEVVNFYYNNEKNTTEAELKSYASNKTLKIQYKTMNAEFDKKVAEFLFSSNEEHWYYYNVCPILKWITKILEENTSISIKAEVEKEVYSEIEVVNAVVHKYTRTEIVNEGEMHIIKVIFAKNLNEFLEENK